MSLLQSLTKTSIIKGKSVEFIGNILEKAFQIANTEERKEEILILAYKFQIPQLNKMIDKWNK